MARAGKARSRQPGGGISGTPAAIRVVAAAGDVEPQALVVSRWFDARDEGEPYSETVRFTGRRVGAPAKPRAGDTFVQEETIEGIQPGSGRVSITTWVYGIQSGEWDVSAELVRPARVLGGYRQPAVSRARIDSRPLPPAAWSWRQWTLSASPPTRLKTRWAMLAPLARSPAVLPGSFTAMAALAIVVALASQAALLARVNVSVGQALVVSLLALTSGVIGAKVLSQVLHPGESIIRGGWAVDGLLVVTPLVAAAALLAFDLPIGVFLDASTPGIFFAVAIGRLGCFFTGCCAGRCTASRWGIWSSDRRVGARRVPTQLLESAAGLVIGVGTLPLVLGAVLPVGGAVFVAAFAVYALVRQVLLRLRAERRKSPRSVPLTAVAAGVALLVVAVLAAAHGS